MTLGMAKDLGVVTCIAGGPDDFEEELKITLAELINCEVVSVSVTNIDAPYIDVGVVPMQIQPPSARHWIMGTIVYKHLGS